MRKTESKYAVCPFYHGEEGFAICCEGPADGSTVKMYFGSLRDKLEYRRRYCETMACFCAYGEALMRLYG
ncbi:MAG: hypothetical protein J5940_00245 [Clostridia bacterium]|nr:hypothetical protein [Clostridia bacterium]